MTKRQTYSYSQISYFLLFTAKLRRAKKGDQQINEQRNHVLAAGAGSLPEYLGLCQIVVQSDRWISTLYGRCLVHCEMSFFGGVIILN